jgi:hypothetical protein
VIALNIASDPTIDSNKEDLAITKQQRKQQAPLLPIRRARKPLQCHPHVAKNYPSITEMAASSL